MFVDSEWRCDLKWARLEPHLGDLEGRKVLDVGAGNGYYSFRAAGAGADAVLAIDPVARYAAQFFAVKKLMGTLAPNVYMLPVRDDCEFDGRGRFDTVLSMGVLYHHRAPLLHLQALRQFLKPGGRLVLETLIVPGGKETVLMPPERYARMKNIWMIPSIDATHIWLARCGFNNIKTVSVDKTTEAEQRSTPWMPYQSLVDGLDPEEQTKTIEGHPALVRALFIADCDS